MADVELLPLPEIQRVEHCGGSYPMRNATDGDYVDHDDHVAAMHAYARANVAHATAAKDAEIEALRAEVEKAKRSVEHTHQWYAVRLEKIKEVAKRVGLWSEVAAIIANGSSSIYDPPTYAQQLNIAKHETKAAEARAEQLAEALRKIEGFTLSQFAGPHDMAAACVDTAHRALLHEQPSTEGRDDG